MIYYAQSAKAVCLLSGKGNLLTAKDICFITSLLLILLTLYSSAIWLLAALRHSLAEGIYI